MAVSQTGYRVISRTNALSLHGYRHAAHVMLHSSLKDTEKKLFNYYLPQHAVMLQMRFDGTLGFPGGFVEDEENLESGLAREVSEELGATAGSLNYMESDLVVSHECFDKKLCLHFYCKKIELEVLRIIEKELIDCPQYGLETLGFIRCPLYTMKDNLGGLPSFLKNHFIGNAKDQLLIGLDNEKLLTKEEIDLAVQRSESIHVT